jgi:hypothetical protein
VFAGGELFVASVVIFMILVVRRRRRSGAVGEADWVRPVDLGGEFSVLALRDRTCCSAACSPLASPPAGGRRAP